MILERNERNNDMRENQKEKNKLNAKHFLSIFIYFSYL